MATTIYWPETLPQSMLIDGFDETPADALLRTPMDAARAKQRARYVRMPFQRRCTFLMTSAQVAIFEEFFRETLGYGALMFYLPKIDDPEEYDTVRFVQNPWQKTPAFPFWRISCNMEVIV